MQNLKIGSRKPSDLCQCMKQLLSEENIGTFFFRQILVQTLSPIIIQIIAVMCSLHALLDILVDKADKTC